MKYISRIKKALFALMIVLLSIMLVKYSPAVARSVQISAELCLNIIVPSLFAFTAVSMMIMKSSAARYICLPLRPLAKYVFNMPEELFTVLIISCIAGYPVGIKLLSDMLDEGRIDKQTAENMSAVCFCGGPAFYCTSIGLAVFGSTRVGMLIFLSVAGANILTAAVTGHMTKPKTLSSKADKSFNAAELCSCVTSAGRTMFTVCSMIIFCSALICVLEECSAFTYVQNFFGLDKNRLIALKSCFEISCLTRLKNHPFELLPLICAVCSFGGLCITAQLFSVKSNKLSLKGFLLSRPPVCALSAGICIVLRPYFVNAAVAASTNSIQLCKVNNFIPSLCLILMIFLLNLKKTLVFSE